MKRYTFETIYVVEAPEETKADEVKAKVESALQHSFPTDILVVEHWAKLTDVEDDDDPSSERGI